MSDNSDGECGGETETLFQCKLCEYTGRSKGDIADHFISTHASIEVIESPIKSKSGGKKRGSQCTTVKLESSKKAEEAIKIPAEDANKKSNLAEVQEQRSQTRPRSQRKRRAPKWLNDEEDVLVTAAKKSREKDNTGLADFPQKVQKQSNKNLKADEGSKEVNDQEEDIKKEREGDEEANKIGLADSPQKVQKQSHGNLKVDEGSKEVNDKEEDIKEEREGDEEAEKGENETDRDLKEDSSKEDSKDITAQEAAKSDKDDASNLKEDWTKIIENQLPITPAEFESKVDTVYSIWEEAWDKKYRLDKIVCNKPSCGATFPEAENELHAKCHMKNYQGFECVYCDERFSHWNKLRKHFVTTHEGISPLPSEWTCDQCNKSFKMIAALKRHKRFEHLRPETAKSIIATHALSKQGEVEQHKKRGPGRPKGSYKKKHTEEDVKKIEEKADKTKLKKEPREKRLSIKWMPTCGKCAAVYYTTEELDNHIGHHNVDDEGRIMCTECKEYIIEKDLHEHMKKLHRRVVNQFRCVLCEFSSNRRHDVKKHMYCHEGFKRFQCDFCGKLMSTPYNLKIHRLRVHATEEEKKVLCSLCGFKCAERAVLKDHMRHKHDLCMNGHSRLNSSKPQFPTFPCKVCDYVGKKESSLTYHMRIHQNDRRYRCNLCSYASKTKNNLILHVRTHKGMGPNKCPKCEFRGATVLIIKEHLMAKHTKEKPLKCPVCNWATCYNGNLWKHMQMHKIKDGIILPGKPKRATRKGIAYEAHTNPMEKLLPITMDGLGESKGEAKDDATECLHVPVTVGALEDGTTTIMVMPGEVQTQLTGCENMTSMVTLETGQQQCRGDTHVVSFASGEPLQIPVSSEANNPIQKTMNLELVEQSQDVDEGRSGEQKEVVMSVSGSKQNIQQSISSIMTSMAASATGRHPSGSSLDGSTLIETQLSASEVASQFQDGTIIEITQIPTSGDGTAILPEGAIVERIAPGMSASDLIMKAANLVASGQMGRFSSEYQYTVPVSINKVLEDDTVSGNTLPFLAHVATTQENLPALSTIAIPVSEEMETNVVTSEMADSNQEGMVKQLVATILPDGSNVMQIIHTPTQDQAE